MIDVQSRNNYFSCNFFKAKDLSSVPAEVGGSESALRERKMVAAWILAARFTESHLMVAW